MPSKKASSTSTRNASSKKVTKKSAASSRKKPTRRAAKSRTLSARFSSWLDTISPASVLGIGLCIVILSIIHSLFIDLGDWYASLPKPSIEANGWIFEFALTGVFAFATAAVVILWNIRTRGKAFLMWLFFLLGMVHVMWSMFFFGLHAVQFAFFDIVVLWILLWTVVLLAWRRSKVAAFFLLPYLGWVTFVAVFNGLIVLHYLA